MKTYSYTREELLNWIPSFTLDTISKNELLTMICEILKLDIKKCSNVNIVNCSTMAPRFEFDYDS